MGAAQPGARRPRPLRLDGVVDLYLYDGRSSDYRGSRREAFIVVRHPFKQVRAPRGLRRDFLYV